TPQDLALVDARKAHEMFQMVGVPILGIIENMSTHICSNCGHEEYIFGHGGAREEAEKLGVAFLGEIPLSANIRSKADAGEIFDLGDDIVKMFVAIQSG
ncbi:MAG TPA: P-loop NTPase, partial [Alphaproteobacteria bacterium]|nr:P-loop NTPase [Alphaproteobacteria bacterium]